MAVNVSQIKDLLGINLAPETVASAVGCSVSYISQLMSQEDFAGEVAEKRATSLQQQTIRDKSIDSIEDKVIARLEEAVDSRAFYKPNDLLRAFHILNGAKRRGTSVQAGAVMNTTVISLVIPSKVVNKFTVSPRGEVIDVAGQTLVTMPSNELINKLRTGAIKGGSGGEKYSEVAKFLPSAAFGDKVVVSGAGKSEAISDAEFNL